MKNILLKAILIFTFGAVAATGWGQAPVITGYSPTQDSTNVPINKVFVLTFDQNIFFPPTNDPDITYSVRIRQIATPSDVTVATYTISIVDGVLDNVSPELTIVNNKLKITQNKLSYNNQYYITMSSGSVENSGAIDCAAITKTSTNKWWFTTAGSPTPPSLSSTTPVDGSITADIATDLTMTFGSNISFNTTGTAHYINVYQTGNGTPVYSVNCVSGGAYYVTGSGLASISGATLTINPTNNLTSSTDYYVTVDNGALESTSRGVYAGFTDQTTWNFKTATPPSVLTYSPIDDAIGVATNASLQLIFNEAITTVGGTGYFHVYTGSTEKYTIPYSSDNVTFNGSTLTVTGFSFVENTPYYVLIDAGFVKSASTAAAYAGISASTTWNFTTTNNAPVTTFNPTNGASGVTLYPTITISFSKAARFADGTVITSANVKNLIVSFTASGHTVNASDYDATISADLKTVILYLRNALKPYKNYTITVAKVEDLNGTEQAANTTSSFTTSAYNVWSGAVDNDIVKSGNYSNGYSSSIGIDIPGGLTKYPIITSDVTVSDIIMEPGSQLTVNNGINLTVDNGMELIASNANNGQPSFINNGNLSVGGGVKYRQRIGSTGVAYLMSSPVVNGKLTATSGTVLKEQIYDPYSWNTLDIATSTLSNGEGYNVTNAAVGSDLVMTGSNFSNSSFSIGTSYTSSNYGWHLAGNPYPCAIEWSDLGKSNLRDRFYIYRNTAKGWGTYNVVNGSVVTVNLQGTVSQIPAFHAFNVQTVNTSTSGSLTFNTSAFRSNDYNYLKSSSVSTSANSIVKLASEVGDFGDETALVYNVSGALETTIDDADKMFSSNVDVLDLYVVTNSGKNVAIKSAPELSGSEITSQIGFRAKRTGNFTLTLSSVSNIPSGYKIILEDITKGVLNDMQLSNYTFSVTSTGSNNTRFKLHLAPSVSTQVDDSKSNEEFVVISDKGLVKAYGLSWNTGSVQIVDVNGRIVFNGSLQELKDGIQINTNGIFVVKVTDSKSCLIRKVLVKR